jgi:ribose 5-phosphate isomerase B
MIVACGFDHAGFPLRDRLLGVVMALGHEVLDLGTDRPDPIDYPDKALEVGRAVVEGRAERGIIVCGSGAGVSVAACKIEGIRATTVHDTYTAHQGVEHDGVNVICMGGRVIGSEVAAEIVAAFLRAEISYEERHVRRRAKVDEIERTGGKPDVAVEGAAVAGAGAPGAGVPGAGEAEPGAGEAVPGGQAAGGGVPGGPPPGGTLPGTEVPGQVPQTPGD